MGKVILILEIKFHIISMDNDLSKLRSGKDMCV